MVSPRVVDLALFRNNHRSFDCVCRNNAANFAQDDNGFFGANIGPRTLSPKTEYGKGGALMIAEKQAEGR